MRFYRFCKDNRNYILQVIDLKSDKGCIKELTLGVDNNRVSSDFRVGKISEIHVDYNDNLFKVNSEIGPYAFDISELLLVCNDTTSTEDIAIALSQRSGIHSNYYIILRMLRIIENMEKLMGR